jgi:hypothetical protein
MSGRERSDIDFGVGYSAFDFWCWHEMMKRISLSGLS